MSKSLGNVVNPEYVLERYGADTFRMYEMFMGPIESSKPWNESGIGGLKKFVEKIWRLYVKTEKISNAKNNNLEKIYHETVKKVTHDFETLNFNTAISQMMIFINAVMKEDVFPKEYAQGFIKLLNPVAPYITEEIWQNVFKKTSTIAYEPWPTFDESKLLTGNVEIIVQVNGKVKAVLNVEKDLKQLNVENLAKTNENVASQLTNKNIIKTVFVPNRLINFVIN